MLNTQTSTPIYNSLKFRNFIIAILRIIVPLFGLAVLGFLLLQIIISNMINNYNISGVRIKKDRLIMESPYFNGVMSNGTKYIISSKSASTAIAGGDEIELSDVKLDLTRLDGYNMQLTSKMATFNMVEQWVDVKGLMNVSTSSNILAELNNSIIDWETQTLSTKDKVLVRFPDGSILTSNSLFHNANAQTWEFEQVTLLIPIKEEVQ